MASHSETRTIVFLFLYSIRHVLGSQCECQTESLSHPGCGVIPTSSTIINGSAASYPWMVFLYNFGDTDNSFCGGILISDLETQLEYESYLLEPPEGQSEKDLYKELKTSFKK